jgi:hypothetical protein
MGKSKRAPLLTSLLLLVFLIIIIGTLLWVDGPVRYLLLAVGGCGVLALLAYEFAGRRK